MGGASLPADSLTSGCIWGGYCTVMCFFCEVYTALSHTYFVFGLFGLFWIPGYGCDQGGSRTCCGV